MLNENQTEKPKVRKQHYYTWYFLLTISSLLYINNYQQVLQRTNIFLQLYIQLANRSTKDSTDNQSKIITQNSTLAARRWDLWSKPHQYTYKIYIKAYNTSH